MYHVQNVIKLSCLVLSIIIQVVIHSNAIVLPKHAMHVWLFFFVIVLYVINDHGINEGNYISWTSF